MHILRLAVIVVALLPFTGHAQSIPIPNIDVENRGKALVRQDASGYYFSSATTSTDTVFYCKDMSCYKLINNEGRTVIDGEITADAGAYTKNGKWTEFYGNGIPKSVSYYCMGTQAGMVQNYYMNGVLSERYSFTVVKGKTTQSLKAGLYQAFYENGRKKTEGFYLVNLNSATQKGPASEKVGKWLEYDANGKKAKEETF